MTLDPGQARGPIGRDRTFRCAAQSLAIDEPMWGTASTVTAWLLLEQPAPWGRVPLVHSRLPRGLGQELVRRARGSRVRLVLIRRADRSTPTGRRCAAIHTGPGRPWLETADLADPRDVLDLDLEALGAGGSPGLGERAEGPMFLVCTHGRRDPCCAERGRPLARALCQAFPAEAWECSHIGGDRFAGNLVCMPAGVYLGRLEPAEGLRAAELFAAGRLDLEHVRGWTSMPFEAQVAALALRRLHGWDRFDDVALVGVRGPADLREVILRGPDGADYRVVVAARPSAPARRLTCHASAAASPVDYEVRMAEPTS